MLGSPGPTSSPRCTTTTSRSAPTWSRPTPSARSRSRSASTTSPSGPTRSTSAAARIAREVAERPRRRFVAGSIGPGHQVRRRSARSASPSCATPTRSRCRGLLEGGVDLLLIETQFDLLGLKAAMIGGRRAMAAAGREVPIQVQVTIELTGRMLPGTEIGAALAAIDPLRPDVIGLNCATGPAEMGEHLRHLSQHSRMPISCLPNAGLPSVVDGKMHYDLTPEQLAEYHAPLRHRARRAGRRRLLRHHARAPRPLVDAVHGPHARGPHARCTSRRPRRSTRSCRSSRTPSFLIIGERTNANGSKKFRDAMLDGDWDTCVEDGQRPGEGRRPRPRRLRRLRRPRRHPRHGRDRAAASPPRSTCRSCSTPPSPR